MIVSNDPINLCSKVDEHLGQCRNYHVYVEYYSKTIPKKAFTVTPAAIYAIGITGSEYTHCHFFFIGYHLSITLPRSNMRDLLRMERNDEKNAQRLFWQWVSRQQWRRMLPNPITCLDNNDSM